MKKIFFVGCLVALLAVLMVPAFATEGIAGAHSTFVTETCPADNRKYCANTSALVRPIDSIDEDGAYVGSTVYVYCEDKNVKNVPTGYMSGEPRLYLDGYLLLAEGWSYSNGIGRTFEDSYETYFVSRRGIVYSKSKFGLYNGNGYEVFDTNRSPSIDVSTVEPYNLANDEYEMQPYLKINENGQTYGTDYFDNYTPDLIAAIGVDGVKGYVYDEDLTNVGLRKSINDAVSDIPTSIPLYDEDGVTVIGEFPIGQR